MPGEVSGNSIAKNIMAAFIMILGLISIIGGIYLIQYVYGVVLGSIFQLTNDGSINVTVGTQGFLNTTETNFIAVMKKVNSGVTFAASFIIIGVVLIVFAGFIVFGFRKYKGMKGGKGGGDMGY